MKPAKPIDLEKQVASLRRKVEALEARLARAQKAAYTVEQLQSVQRKGYIHGWRKASEYWKAVVDNTLRRMSSLGATARNVMIHAKSMQGEVEDWDTAVRKRMQELETPYAYEANVDGFHSPPVAVAAVDGGTGDFEPMTGEATSCDDTV